MYTSRLLDHFQNPRNAGDIAEPDAQAEIENPVCGDVLRLTLRLEGECISEARFKAKGCVPSMACGSVITEMVLGKPIQRALLIRKEDLIEAVGGLPPASTHAAQLAIDVLQKALASKK